MLLSRGQSFL